MEYAELEYIMRMYSDSSQLDNFKHELLHMNQYNLNRILTQHADSHLRSADGTYNLRGFMGLAVIARALNEGKDENFIQSLYGANDFANNSRRQEIRDMQDTFVIHTERDANEQGKQSEWFAQTSTLNVEDLPLHGWKYHVSANTIDEYHLLYALVVPELEALGVPFKTVQVEKFEEQLKSNQHGKLLTIYPPFDVSKLSKAAQDFLYNRPSQELSMACAALNKNAVAIGETTKLFNPISNNIIAPDGDMNIAGRLFARYGRFRPSCAIDPNTRNPVNFITSPDGRVEYDPKYQRQYKPDFVEASKPEDILNFYSNIEKKFIETGDRKTYMQEYFTMCQSDGKSHAYMIFEINPQDKMSVKNALFSGYDLNGLSFVANGPDDGKTYLFLHATAIQNYSNIQNYTLQNGGDMFVRPIWDVKKTSYEFSASELHMARTVAKAMENTYGYSAVNLLQTHNGKYIIQCDSVLDNIFVNYCAQTGLQLFETKALDKSPLCSFFEKLTGKELHPVTEISIDEPVQSNNDYYR